MQLMMRKVAVVGGVGVLHAVGSYTGVRYTITPQGVLIHPHDVDDIVAQQRTFCCTPSQGARTIHPFFEGKLTSAEVSFVEVPEPDDEGDVTSDNTPQPSVAGNDQTESEPQRRQKASKRASTSKQSEPSSSDS